MRLADGFPKWRHLLLAAALGIMAALAPALASSETGPTVEAVNEPAGAYEVEHHRWSPSAVAVMAGNVVTFQNTTAVYHGVAWDGGPETPSCTGVPINTGEANWKGTCTFGQAGIYTFHCVVHPEMTGRVEATAAGTTATTTTTTSATPPPPPPSEKSAPPSLTGAVSVARNQHGPSVHGSIQISKALEGARLKIDLLVRGDALGHARRRSLVRVGGLSRGSLSAGRLSFSMRLDAAARRSLERRKRLVLTVRVVVTPATGAALTLHRVVVVRV